MFINKNRSSFHSCGERKNLLKHCKVSKLFETDSSSNIPVQIDKNPVEKLCKVVEMELKTYTQVGPKFVFEKSRFKFRIVFNMISLAND